MGCIQSAYGHGGRARASVTHRRTPLCSGQHPLDSFAKILSFIQQPAMMLDASLDVVFLNAPFASLLRIEAGDNNVKGLQGQPLLSLLATSDVAQTKIALSVAQQGGQSAISEGICFSLPGQPVVRTPPLRIHCLQHAGVIGFFVECSQGPCSRPDDRYKIAVEAAPCGMLMIDRSGTMVLVNARACAMFGYEAWELLGHKLEMLLPVHLRERHPRIRDRFFDDPRPRLFTHAPVLQGVRKDGTQFPLEIALSPIDTPDGLLALAGLMDVTEQNILRQRFITAVECAPAGLLMIGTSAEVALMNAKLEEMLGRTKADACKLRVDDLLQLEEHTQAGRFPVAFETLVEQAGTHVDRDLWAKRADGSSFPVDVAVRSLDGRELLAFIVDVTTRKDYEQRRREAEAAEFLACNSAALLATMSHEIRTPLTGLLGCLELLLGDEAGPHHGHLITNTRDVDETPSSPLRAAPQEGTEGEQPSSLLRTASRCADVLLDTINDILAYASAESGAERREVDVVSMHAILGDVQEVLSTQLKAGGLSWIVFIDPAFPKYITTDGARLRRIILNIAGNAVKFTYKGGLKVSVSCCGTFAGPSNVQPEAAATVRRPSIPSRTPTNDPSSGVVSVPALMRVVIEDTGIGMSEATLSRLFTPFMQADRNTTRHFGGTGLGLAICKRLASLLGGDISVRSELGVGTCFTICLPIGMVDDDAAAAFDPGSALHDGSSVTAQVGHSSALDTLSKARVLVVDDDGVGAAVVAATLKRLGCGAVTVARDGQKGVAAALADPSINLILMDCEMPHMDGFTATRELRRSGLRLPIVAMTANAMLGDRERCMAAGMDDYMAKPVLKAALAEMVAKHARVRTSGVAVDCP